MQLVQFELIPIPRCHNSRFAICYNITSTGDNSATKDAALLVHCCVDRMLRCWATNYSIAGDVARLLTLGFARRHLRTAVEASLVATITLANNHHHNSCHHKIATTLATKKFHNFCTTSVAKNDILWITVRSASIR